VRKRACPGDGRPRLDPRGPDFNHHQKKKEEEKKKKKPRCSWILPACEVLS